MNEAWISVRAGIFEDLKTRWPSAPKLDELDIAGYEMVLEPLESYLAFRSAEDPKVWKVRFGIRNARFRPSVQDVETLVEKCLPSDPVDIVRTPQMPEKPDAPRLDTSARWHKALSPTKDDALNGILHRAMESLRQARGEDAAVRAARELEESRRDRARQRQEAFDAILAPMPPEVRQEWVTRARQRLPATAFELVVAQTALRLWRKDSLGSGRILDLSEWHSHWQAPEGA